MLLLAAVAGSGLSGLAGAQSQTFQKSVDGSPSYVAIDTTGMEPGTFTLEVVVSPAPGGGSDVIYREEKQVSNVPDVWYFGNAKAYENVTFKVSGVSSEPDIGPGSAFSTLKQSNTNTFLYTSGDRNYQCGLGDRIASITSPLYQSSDCGYTLPGTTSVNTTSLDANETKLQIYQSAATQADSAKNTLTVLNNRLEDTTTVSLIKGKGGYLSEWNETGSETSARAAAKSNITEYYSVMERNVLSEWNSNVDNYMYLKGLAENESGVSSKFVNPRLEDIYDGKTSEIDRLDVVGTGTRSYKLQNGSRVDYQTLMVNITVESIGEGQVYEIGFTDANKRIGPTDDHEDGVVSSYDNPGKNATINDFIVNKPKEDNYQPQEAFVLSEYNSSLNEIESQTNSAANQMDTVVDQTIGGLQSGDVSVSDMIDPYVLQNQFSAGTEFQGWAAANLAMLGVNQPTNYSQTGYMNVTIEDGTHLQGVVMSAESPASGQFEVNQTYDPATIGGSQWITLDSSIREIQQNFTITEIRTANGETRRNFTIVKKTYNTTSADDLIALNNQLAELQAAIEARESAFGGGGGFGGFGGENGIVIIAGIALVGYGVTRD
jgi:hypothetical protein